VSEVSVHSYRHSWALRAKACGYPVGSHGRGLSFSHFAPASTVHRLAFFEIFNVAGALIGFREIE